MKLLLSILTLITAFSTNAQAQNACIPVDQFLACSCKADKDSYNRWIALSAVGMSKEGNLDGTLIETFDGGAGRSDCNRMLKILVSRGICPKN